MMELTDGQSTDKILSGVFEAKYAYYRRCCQLRTNGEQCKGPAMKGENVCYSHYNQAELARFHDRQRRNLLGALLVASGSTVEARRALHRVSVALMAGHIDEKTAGRLLVEIEKMISAADRGRPTPRDRG
jgi:hypothetical protein